MILTPLKPFWRYYGGKYRAAPHYPPPVHPAIIEPFAGAAGYSTRYPEHMVFLHEKYPAIHDIWEFLINASPDDVLSIPEVERLDDLPTTLHPGARALVGFSFNDATTRPSNRLSAGRKKLRTMGRRYEGWNAARRQRIASQVERISHWGITQGSYEDLPNFEATWFIDPPYQKQGRFYVKNQIDYRHLASWCCSRKGQVIVCEQDGADWLPFRTFRAFKRGIGANGQTPGSIEVIWTNE